MVLIFWGDRLQLHSLDCFLCGNDVCGDRLQLHSLDGLLVWLSFFGVIVGQLHSLDGWIDGC